VQTRGGPAWYRVSENGPDQVALSESVGAIAALIEQAAAAHSLTADDVVLAGFSQGGATALATLLDPVLDVRLRAMAVIAGYLPDRDGLDLTRAAGLSMLFTHGTDDEMMDIVRGRSAAKALERSGATVTWVEVESLHRLGAPLLDPFRGWLDTVTIGDAPSAQHG
jgi:predicted esterase